MEKEPDIPMLSNKAYDFLKELALVYLPALGTLYFAVATIWGLPAPESVVGTIVAVDTFLAAVLKLSKSSYENSGAKYDGAIVVQKKAGELVGYSLELKGEPETLRDKEEVVFEVKPS